MFVTFFSHLRLYTRIPGIQLRYAEPLKTVPRRMILAKNNTHIIRPTYYRKELYGFHPKPYSYCTLLHSPYWDTRSYPA